MEYMESKMQDQYDAWDAQERDRVELGRLDGFFVGSLSSDELVLFERAVINGEASRSFTGGPGLLGLARVAITK